MTNLRLDQSVVNLISAPDLEFEDVSLSALTVIFLPLPAPACPVSHDWVEAAEEQVAAWEDHSLLLRKMWRRQVSLLCLVKVSLVLDAFLALSFSGN